MDKLHIIALVFSIGAVILSAIAFHKQNKKENFYAEPAPKKSVVPIIIGVVFFVILMAIFLAPVKYGTISFPAFSF